MKNPKELAKLIITAFFAPTACYVAIIGANKSDGSQVLVAIAMVTALGGMWGFPTSKDKDDSTKSGGSHAA